MTLKKNLILLVVFIIINSCNNFEEEIEPTNQSISGKWRLRGGFVSNGGPQYFVENDSNEIIDFFDNGKFQSNKYDKCTEGIFRLEEKKIFFKYECDNFIAQNENEDGFIVYKLELYTDYFLLRPFSGPFCIEGCSYKYERE